MIYARTYAHPLMKLCDEPQLRLQVGSVLLGSDVTQEVFMSHAWCDEYVPLVLPWLLILHKYKSWVYVFTIFPSQFWKDTGSAFHVDAIYVVRVIVWASDVPKDIYPNLWTSRSSFNNTVMRAFPDQSHSSHHLDEKQQLFPAREPGMTQIKNISDSSEAW